MISNFLTWTTENEQSIENSFIWKDCDAYQLIVHDTGILEYLPKSHTKEQLILSCAIHGNETAPIEILDSIIEDLFHERIESKKNILFIFGNPKAMNISKRFSEENLNRLFAGGLEGKPENYETLRAKIIIDLVDKFYKPETIKFHYDLHTAIRDSKISKFAISPFAPNLEIDRSQLALLKDLSVDAVILGNSPATTFSYHSSSLYNAKSFTVELGKVKAFGKNDPKDFKDVNSVLREVVQDKYQYRENFEGLKVYKIKTEIIKTHETFNFSFSSETANFTQFLKGSVIYNENNKDYYSEDDSSYILFPNKNVKIGERAALIITSKDLPI